MKKVYLVEEFGGVYEDAWNDILGVFSSRELAEQLVAKVREEHSYPEAIPEDTWEDILDAVSKYELNHDVDLGDITEAAHKLFPQYSIEDIKKANKVEYSRYDWSGVEIREKDLIETESDLNTINGNYN